MNRPYSFRKLRSIATRLEQGTPSEGRDIEHALLLSRGFASGQKESLGITLHALTPRGRVLLDILQEKKYLIRLEQAAVSRGLPPTLTNILKLHLLLTRRKLASAPAQQMAGK